MLWCYAGYYGGYDMGRYRVTIQEAANRLGVKEGAIRKRIERGTIESEKDDHTGRVFVYVDEPPLEDHDTGYDGGYDALYPEGYDTLVRSMQEQIEWLRRELERKDHLLAMALERIPAIEAPPDTPPSEPREGPETAAEEPGEGSLLSQSRRSPFRGGVSSLADSPVYP
jgi:hypothetical protein